MAQNTHQWVDVLVGDVVVGGRVVLDHGAVHGVVAFANSVDFLVDFSSVVVALLTGSGHRERHSTRMPGTDTGDLSQTLVCLSRQLLGVPTRGDTLIAFTLRHADAVDQFVLQEHVVDVHLFFQVLARPVDLLGDRAAVHLNLHDVRLFLTKTDFLHLGVSDHTHYRAVLLDSVQIFFDLLLARIVLPLLARSGVGSLLRFAPVVQFEVSRGEEEKELKNESKCFVRVGPAAAQLR